MKTFRNVFLLLFILGLFAFPSTASAQDYRFEVPAMEVEAYIEEDGTLSLWYYFELQNSNNGAPIQFVDIGMPSSSYSFSNIEATVNDTPVSNFESSDYVPNGFAVNLGDLAIPPGESGVVTIWIYGVQEVLTPYDEGDRDNYVNFQFSPTWFDPQADKSNNTEYRVTIILPPGVGDNEGVFYYPEKWPGPDAPDDTGRTAAEERIYYSWFTGNANAHTQYIFGAAFPNQHVPEDSVVADIPIIGGSTGSSSGSGGFGAVLSFLSGNICCFGGGLLLSGAFIWAIYQGTVGANKRKMSYLPPKMKIEGHGIKRGLTAVEAAILMEQPMNKILTMVLFGSLKKEAVIVEQSEPLKLQVPEPMPDGLHPYEIDFLKAFQEPEKKRREALQKMMVTLVNEVSSKMKGFSRKETLAYYEDIMSRAWKMVEDAETPEVKSEKYDQTLEWTMLDKEYEDRTRRTFTGGPVFVPLWWPRYSPTYRESIGGLGQAGSSIGRTSTGGATIGGSKPSLPNIPGSDFAARVINGSTVMAAGVVGNLTNFTTGITNRTNPIPVSTSSGSGGFRGGGGGGGSSCACACACAGCACACAGGGR